MESHDPRQNSSTLLSDIESSENELDPDQWSRRTDSSNIFSQST